MRPWQTLKCRVLHHSLRAPKLLDRRQLDRELGDVGPSKAIVRRRRVRRLPLGDSGSHRPAARWSAPGFEDT
jgi:hypothetical protein